MDRGLNLDEKEVTILLQQCEAKISTLLYQLEHQKSLKLSLEQKLAIIRGSNAPTTLWTSTFPATTKPSVPPMGRMPKEILFMISPSS